MRNCLILIGLAVWAGQAQAQDLRYSDDATVACVFAAETPAGQKACIGTSAGACIDATSDGGTTVGTGACLGRELDYWDKRLNAGYKVLTGKAKSVDAEMRELGSSAPSLEESLRAMQREWIRWRDATCDFERAQWGGGTGGGPATASCLMRLTGEQALYLETVWLGD